MCRSTNYYGNGHEVIDPFTFTDFHISLDRHVGFSEKVKDKETNKPMVRNKKQRMKKLKLEDIPEDKELFCIGNSNSYIDDDHGCVDMNTEVEEALEMDLEVLRRTVDMGIWVVCLGLGYMFSKAKFRPPTFS
ncbi:hypothetical protein Lal_00031833 [Lupinus albus]|uniref:Uncharacterized protein n=1 Tax=Lupinus albus TaxID=3870 RepID=A0A6A4NL97_LUPAL|nr:hypothetical protein Lalb_Chr23g0273501 [Lupinus albus]KAF1864870.1 hypothetical protein Lal_00031833 [Lupinus albus]